MRYLYTFFIMMGFWILLSGKFDLFHLALGVISSALVSFLSADLLMYEQGKDRLALHPKMKDQIDPTIVTFKTKLTTNMAKVALANSITLTPGTITIRIEEQVFYVHAISRKAAAGLPGEMEERLAKVFERG